MMTHFAQEPIFERLAIEGVGLLGASAGLAARRANIAGHIVGLDRSSENGAQALALGAVDETAADFDAALTGLSEKNSPVLIVAAVPASAIADVLAGAAGAIRRLGAKERRRRFLLTDVGSVKAGVVRALAERLEQGEFPENAVYIGSHPVAGSEKSGPDAARADLFDDKWTVLTEPEFCAGEEKKLEGLETLERFWTALGSRVFRLSAAEHDRIFGRTSHLPHLLSTVLAALSHSKERPCVGSGLIDMTRLAAGNPEVWSDIFLMNADAVLQALEQTEHLLTAWKTALAAADRSAVTTLLQEAKKRRDALGS